MDKILNALIIGGSSGIGECVANKLGAYNVINVSRTECKVEGVRNIACDVAVKEERDRALNEINGAFDKIDLFIYSAGSSMSAPLEYTLEDNYRYLYEVNFFGCVEMLKGTLNLIKAACGQVILISSVASVVPIPFDPFYDASKASLNSLAIELNVELKKYGVKVAAALVGGVKTSFTFKRLVYGEDLSREYSEDVKKAAETLSVIEQNGAEIEYVAEKILGLIGKEGCHAIGLSSKLMILINRFVCDRSLAFILSRIFCR